jgi:hypothetical protein
VGFAIGALTALLNVYASFKEQYKASFAGLPSEVYRVYVWSKGDDSACFVIKLRVLM